MNWLKGSRQELKFNEPLGKYTSFKIGGKAEVFIEPRSIDGLRGLIINAKKDKIPFFVIGAGTNLLIQDKLIKGVVIKLCSPAFRQVSLDGNVLNIGAGLRISEVIKSARDLQLGGLEFLAGIPGSVGGALVMNAGIVVTRPEKPVTRSIGNLVKEVTVMDYNGRIKTINKDKIRFGYRKSNLDKYIILGAGIRLIRKDEDKIKDEIKYYLNRRRKAQSITYPNAGCIFKNPNGDSAGRLIDLCGLKGRRVGGAQVSERHANFIVNRCNARACDVLHLMDLIQKRVKEKFNIDLEPEIKIW